MAASDGASVADSSNTPRSWHTIAGVGVFTFTNSFKQQDVSGFCLYDAEFPIIYVNNRTAQTRQIFTAHLA